MRRKTRVHLLAATGCVVLSALWGGVTHQPTPWGGSAMFPASSASGSEPGDLSPYRQGDVVWESCGLGISDSGARYLGPAGEVLYVVIYSLDSREAASQELTGRLAGRMPQGRPWDIRCVRREGDVWVAEFSTPFALSEELDAQRWPRYACAQVDGSNIRVVYGPTREHVLALHRVLATCG